VNESAGARPAVNPSLRLPADTCAHLIIRIGRTTTVIFHREALTSYRSAWAQALEYGQRIVANPDPDAFDELESKAREREARHFERTGRSPNRP
jgi:hypothetical protein